MPVLAIRGENSDILSEKTLAEMRARHPRLTAVTVRGQGHAPLLRDAPTIGAIAGFLARTDGETHARGAGALRGGLSVGQNRRRPYCAEQR